ncbi:MAG: hypothetical protein LBL79_10305, partial [Prevotella sp.]|nr:hypothetical protein [Prevotella sp.]
DVLQKTAFHLNAIQTPPLAEITLLGYYCQIVKENCLYFKEVSSCLVAGAFFFEEKSGRYGVVFGFAFYKQASR